MRCRRDAKLMALHVTGGTVEPRRKQEGATRGLPTRAVQDHVGELPEVGAVGVEEPEGNSSPDPSSSTSLGEEDITTAVSTRS